MTAHIETMRASVLCLLLGAISAIGWWWGEAPLATSKPVVRVEAIDLSLDVAPPAEAAVTDRELSLPLIHPHAGGWPDRLAVIVVNDLETVLDALERDLGAKVKAGGNHRLVPKSDALAVAVLSDL